MLVQVAIAIGMLAMLDQHLTGLPWVYDGPRPEFEGRTVTIDYCMLSTSPVAVAPSNCRFAFAAASVSLALSLIWTYIQVSHISRQLPVAAQLTIYTCIAPVNVLDYQEKRVQCHRP